MPDRDRLARERLLLLWEMAELHRQTEEASHRAQWWRQEARATHDETRQVVAQAQELIRESRLRWGERAGPVEAEAPPSNRQKKY